MMSVPKNRSRWKFEKGTAILYTTVNVLSCKFHTTGKGTKHHPLHVSIHLRSHKSGSISRWIYIVTPKIYHFIPRKRNNFTLALDNGNFVFVSASQLPKNVIESMVFLGVPQITISLNNYCGLFPCTLGMQKLEPH